MEEGSSCFMPATAPRVGGKKEFIKVFPFIDLLERG